MILGYEVKSNIREVIGATKNVLFDTYSNYKHHYFFIGSANVTSWLVLRAFEWVLISSVTLAKVSTYKINDN